MCPHYLEPHQRSHTHGPDTTSDYQTPIFTCGWSLGRTNENIKVGRRKFNTCEVLVLFPWPLFLHCYLEEFYWPILTRNRKKWKKCNPNCLQCSPSFHLNKMPGLSSIWM